MIASLRRSKHSATNGQTTVHPDDGLGIEVIRMELPQSGANLYNNIIGSLCAQALPATVLKTYRASRSLSLRESTAV